MLVGKQKMKFFSNIRMTEEFDYRPDLINNQILLIARDQFIL